MDPVLLCYDWAPGFDFALLEYVPHTCHVRPDGENFELFRRRLEAQEDGARHSMAAMLELIRERYPTALQIHDCFVLDAPAEEAPAVADVMKKRMSDVLRNWHKTAGFGLQPSVHLYPKSVLDEADDWSAADRSSRL
jgi:hypothetical protein